MSILIIELLLLVYLGALSWRLVRSGLVKNLVGLVSLLLATLLGLALCAALAPALRAAVGNPFVRLMIYGLLGTAAWAAVSLWGRRLGRRVDVDALRRRLHLHGWADRAAALLCVAVVWVGVLVLASLAGRMLSLTRYQQPIAERSLVMRAFLSPESIPPADPPPADSVAEAISAQRRLLAGLRRGVRSSSELVLEKTGTKQAARQLEALRRIIALPEADKAYLIEHEPAIGALIDHPSIIAAAQNPEVQRLIEQVGAGSPMAVYRLGDRPEIRTLLEDRTVLEAARAVDLVEMIERLDRRADPAADGAAGSGQSLP